MSEEYDRYKVPYETNLGDYMDEMRVRFYDGIEVEQSRIIKLLEDKQGFCHEINRGKKCDHEQCKWFPYIIELIKGENK